MMRYIIPVVYWYYVIKICIVFIYSFFWSSDYIPFIFLIFSSVWMSFSWILEYLWHPKRSADGQVLLYPMKVISVEIYFLCKWLYCLGDKNVHERGQCIFGLRWVKRYNFDWYFFEGAGEKNSWPFSCCWEYWSELILLIIVGGRYYL